MPFPALSPLLLLDVLIPATCTRPGAPPSPAQVLSTSILLLSPQAISHLLASVFEDLSTADVTGEDVETRWAGSQGGADAYQERFAEELQKVQAEAKSELGALFSRWPQLRLSSRWLFRHTVKPVKPVAR